jgi:cell division septum initiation protein DivIVA
LGDLRPPDVARSTITLVPKATSVSPGKSRSSPAAGSKPGSTERNADKLVQSARQEATRLLAEAKAEAKRIRTEADEHARGRILDARATADGVRAEGMEVVSNLRQISDTLRELSEQVLQDVQAIHARMVGELERVGPEAGPAADPPAATAPARKPPAGGADDLEVPDFVARG